MLHGAADDRIRVVLRQDRAKHVERTDVGRGLAASIRVCGENEVCELFFQHTLCSTPWTVTQAPRRISSRNYEVRCVPVSDSEYYTKSDGFSGKIVGRSRWFSISLRTLRSLRLKHIVTERPQARKSL